MHLGRRAVRHRAAAAASPLELTIDACLAAIEDAGLTTADIDGLSTYPGPDGRLPAGFSGAGAYEVIDALRLNCRLVRQRARDVGPARLGDERDAWPSRSASPITCCASVRCGKAPRRATRAGPRCSARWWRWWRRVQGCRASWSGTCRSRAPSAAIWIAMYAQAHFHRYGTTSEQLAWIALNARRNAELNPKAIYRDPMTMDDYMNVAHDLDAVLVCSTATRRATARPRSSCRALRCRVRTCGTPPLRVEAVGARMHGRPSWDQFDDLTAMPNRDAAQADVGAHRSEARRRADGCRPTTGSRGSRCRGSKRSASAASAKAARSSTAASDIARDGQAAAEHPRRTTVGRTAARLRLLARGRASRCGAKAATARSPTSPEVGRIARRRRQHLRLPPPRPRLTPPSTTRHFAQSGPRPSRA